MAKRGTKPKPSHLKIISGNPGKRPINDQEPEIIEPLGTPPAGWQAGAKVLWHEMVDCAPEAVLTKADRHLMEIAVRLLAQIRSNAEVNAATVAQFRACLSEMGMTPSARTRLYTGGRSGTENPFADLD